MLFSVLCIVYTIVYFVLYSAGVGRTGVFIALSIVLERMRYEGVVDLFQTVKLLRTQRQGIIQSEVRSPLWRSPLPDYRPLHGLSSRAYSKEFFGVHNFKSSCMM